MNFKEELTERIFVHRLLKEQPALSNQAAEELRAAVTANPMAYLEDSADKAFMHLGEVLMREDELRSEEEFMDDEAFERARHARMERIVAGCKEALEIDPSCLDAKTVQALSTSDDANDVFEALLAIEQSLGGSELAGLKAQPLSAATVEQRPYLRFYTAYARWSLNTTRYKLACKVCWNAIERDPDDIYGARYTLAIALARLENEESFNKLDARFCNKDSAWSNLARVLLMFKLDRIPAARRALRTYAQANRGAAYALLRPVYVEAYLPDRPKFEPGSFEEAVLAVHECDPIIMDTPDFLSWCQAQNGFADAAQAFAQDNDLDW